MSILRKDFPHVGRQLSLISDDFPRSSLKVDVGTLHFSFAPTFMKDFLQEQHSVRSTLTC